MREYRHGSFASLDFLYVEHASQAFRSAKDEMRKRAGAAAAAGPAAGAPLSLGEIKRKEAERKAKEAASGEFLLKCSIQCREPD